MQNIIEILEKDSISDINHAIITYYEQYLGIKLNIIKFPPDFDDPLEPYEAHAYILNDISKIPQIIKKSYTESDNLGADDLANIVVTHFDHAVSKEENSKLSELKHHLTQLIEKSNEIVHNIPRLAIMINFLNYLSFSIGNRLGINHLEKALKDKKHNEDSMMGNKEMISQQIQNQIPNFLLKDLFCFAEIIEQFPSYEAQYFQNLKTDLDIRIETYLMKLADNCDIMSLTEHLSDLKTLIQAIAFLSQMESQELHAKLYPLLETSIKSIVLELLNEFEKDLKKTYTDNYKNEKVNLIQKIRTLCMEKSNLNELFKMIHTHEKILKTNSLGRYLYQCICWLFKKQIEKPVYQKMKLFDIKLPTDPLEQTATHMSSLFKKEQ